MNSTEAGLAYQANANALQAMSDVMGTLIDMLG
jgi:Zn-dependent metalloprotease